MLTTIPECSVAARLLGELLARTPAGGLVTYEAADALTGADTRKRRHYWRTAREIARREGARVFACVMRVGYRCLADGEKAPVLGESFRCRTHRAARRTRRNLDTIDMTGLDATGRLAAITAMTHASFIAEATAAGAAKRLTAVVEKSGVTAPLAPARVPKEIF